MNYKAQGNLIEAYVGGSTITGEWFDILHNGFIFDNCPFREQSGFSYDQIKDLNTVDIPDKIHFRIINYDQNKVEKPMDLVPYPFVAVVFSKEGNDFSVLFELTEYDDEEEWRTQINFVYEYYYEALKVQIEQFPEFELIKLPHAHGESTFVKVVDNNSVTINDVLDRALPKINELLLNTNMSLQGIKKFTNAIKFWYSNKDNNIESQWHEFFVENSWILSQCFATPFLLFKDKAYAGGKDIGNSNGSVLDFIFKNNLIDTVAIFEIKTPSTSLIGKKYRNDIYSTSSELSGSINQVLNYKDRLQKEYFINRYNSATNFTVLNPKCILIIGKIEGLNEAERKSFELLRSELKSIEIITYDELFEKIMILKDLIALS